MKSIKYYLGLIPVLVFLCFAQTNLTSCQKETQFITDTLRLKDTIVIKDTVRTSDTTYCQNLKDGLVAYYNFNGGTQKDSSGSNNHIVYSNAVQTADRFGRANNAYLFDGSTTYMRVANSQSLNPRTGITISAIIKIHDFYRGNCGGNQIIGKGVNDFINGFYALRIRSTVGCNTTVDTSKEVFYGNYGDMPSRLAPQNLNHFIHANQWYHVVFTYAPGEARLYVNGTLIQTLSGTAVFTPNNQDVFIGKHDDFTFPYWFKGVIDELRIYNRVLCQGDVNKLNALKD
jgi:hypothetical protein